MATVNGTAGSDIFRAMLVGSAEDDKLFGREGNDWLDGGPGADQLYGGGGEDMARYDLDPRGVSVSLKTGLAVDGYGKTDTLSSIEWIAGSEFDDTLIGAKGANDLLGLGGDDILRGGAGHDDFWGGSGKDSMDGGTGLRDRIWYSHDPSGAVINLTTGQATDGWGATDRLSRIEDVVGSKYDDLMIGNGKANRLWGDSGDDSLRGENGKDTLDGGAGDDRMAGGRGKDLLIAGAGDDTFSGGAGWDRLVVDFGEAISATASDINLGAGKWRHLSDSGAAQGRIRGIEAVTIEGDVDVTLKGSKFANTLTGADGNDLIIGGEGDDRLSGRAGDDTLTGGEGADVFAFVSGFATDTVTDFNASEGDRLAITASGEVAGLAAFLRASVQSGADVIYDLAKDGQNVIVIQGVELADLTSENFDFG